MDILRSFVAGGHDDRPPHCAWRGELVNGPFGETCPIVGAHVSAHAQVHDKGLAVFPRPPLDKFEPGEQVTLTKATVVPPRRFDHDQVSRWRHARIAAFGLISARSQAVPCRCTRYMAAVALAVGGADQLIQV